MCYFLYGGINSEADINGCNEAIFDSEFHFNKGSAKDVNACVAACGDSYRITNHYCDCDSAIGGGDENQQQLLVLRDLLQRLKNVLGVKYVLISKNWWGDKNVCTESVHIDDIDVPSYFANAEDNCLYKIELYNRYC